MSEAILFVDLKGFARSNRVYGVIWVISVMVSTEVSKTSRRGPIPLWPAMVGYRSGHNEAVLKTVLL